MSHTETFTARIRPSVHRVAALLAGAGLVTAVGLSGAHAAAASTPAGTSAAAVTVTAPAVPGVDPTHLPVDDGVTGWD